MRLTTASVDERFAGFLFQHSVIGSHSSSPSACPSHSSLVWTGTCSRRAVGLRGRRKSCGKIAVTCGAGLNAVSGHLGSKKKVNGVYRQAQTDERLNISGRSQSPVCRLGIQPFWNHPSYAPSSGECLRRSAYNLFSDDGNSKVCDTSACRIIDE